MHFLFFWPDQNYYGKAASGVFYDAINRGIPLISSEHIRLLDNGLDLGVVVNEIDEVYARLERLTAEEYKSFVNNISIYSTGLEVSASPNNYKSLVLQKW